MLRKLKYIILTLTLFGVCNAAKGQTSSYGELQAAYVFNFAKYIKWPAENSVFIIGVMDHPEMAARLHNTLKDKKVGGRLIEVREIASPEEAATCNIIYLSGSSSRRLGELKQGLTGKRVLIVTEEDLIRRGAIISFIVEDDKLRFKLKKAALEEAGLEASEGLLRLAIIL